jgi:FdhD protein
VHVIAEDIGRHNSVDKIAGKCLLEDIRMSRKFLLTTGRISSEMLQKSSRIGASIVVSRTSPSSLSIELADRFGITLIGYARRDRFNVYTHPDRITNAPDQESHYAPETTRLQED